MPYEAGKAEFSANINVSRETMADLECYVSLLLKWSPRINLVSKSTLPNVWVRHMLDSAQVLKLAQQDHGHWVDLGTGGGFPGLVVAIMARELLPKLKFTFVESDARKAVFLQTVLRTISLKATVLTKRIETLRPLAADILTARALAPLTVLLAHSNNHLKTSGQALLMMGASFRREMDEALEFWTFRSDEYPSITDGRAVILSLKDIKRV